MPKEQAHWYIARDASKLLPAGVAAESIAAYENIYYLGAVAYDSPFYAIGLPNRDLIKQVAKELHGITGEDTIARFRKSAKTLDKDSPSTKLAFLAGALTHYAADVTIHPMVNYFCNESPIRERRHRAFETCMDVYLTSKRQLPDPVAAGLGKLLPAGAVKNAENAELANIVATFFRNDGSIDSQIVWRMLRRHAAIRDRFDAGALRTLVRGYARMDGEDARVLAATFYPTPAEVERMLPLIDRFFGSIIPFRHPRTGESIEKDLAGLMTTAAELAASLIVALSNSEPVNQMSTPAENGSSMPTTYNSYGFSLDAGCDVNAYPDEYYHGFAQDLADTGFFYE